MSGLQRRQRAVVFLAAGAVVLRMPMARLRVARAAMLFVPFRIMLGHQTDLAMGFGQRAVGATGRGQFGDELQRRRRQQAVDRGGAEAGKRHEETVELAGPIEHAIVAGVGNQYVQPATAIGKVARAGGVLHVVGVVGLVVRAAVRVEVVVELVIVIAQPPNRRS